MEYLEDLMFCLLLIDYLGVKVDYVEGLEGEILDVLVSVYA